MRFGLRREDIEHPWLLARCQEVQEGRDGHLDLWAREHYKSTIITFGLTIMEILASHGDDPLIDRELTFGIFSHTRPIAKKFLRQIQFELEANTHLQGLFPDVLYQNPAKDAPAWSLDSGIVVRRRGNPKEATVEAWGLVDSQPTSAHFDRLVYDDVVTIASVTSPEMMAKTTGAIELSYNLGAHGGKRRFIGTRYHANDTYRTILERGTAEPRIYRATVDGEVNGDPVFLSRDELAAKRRDMGPYTFACQMMQNPVADERQGFKRDWIRYHKGSDGSGMNRYLIVDPANEKKRGSDYTAMCIIGLGTDANYYLLDFTYDRLSLTERTRELFRLHRKWKPRNVYYEKYGKDTDIEHIQDVMEQDNYRFGITPIGGTMAKNDRIKRLIPIFEQGRWYIPETLFRTMYDGKTVDLIEKWLHEEYDAFPVPVHDDGLDCMARILDPDVETIWPKAAEERDRYAQRSRRRGSAWAA